MTYESMSLKPAKHPSSKGPTVRQVTTSVAARLLELSSHRIRQLSDAGLIPHTDTPLGRLYEWEHLKRIRAVRSPFGTYRAAALRSLADELATEKGQAT